MASTKDTTGDGAPLKKRRRTVRAGTRRRSGTEDVVEAAAKAEVAKSLLSGPDGDGHERRSRRGTPSRVAPAAAPAAEPSRMAEDESPAEPVRSGGSAPSSGSGGSGAGGSGSHGGQHGSHGSGQGVGGSGPMGGQDGDGEDGMRGSLARRKRKKRNRASTGYGVRPPSYGLPSDEELEREAAELERAAAKMSSTELSDARKYSLPQLQQMDIAAINRAAEREGLEDTHHLTKQDLIFKILKARATRLGIMFGEGTLEILPDGFGFLRSPEQSYLPGPDDIYVSSTQIRRYGLRRGMEIRGAIRPPKESEKYFALLRVDLVNDRDPSAAADLVNFEDLTPLHPEKRFMLETTPEVLETRIIDLVAPIGFGQRALIVAPPRTGKTVLMQRITKAISTNYPAVKVLVLLVDERPEEVTDFRRNTAPSVEVVASTFDEDSSRHTAVCEVVINKARRMVEFGDDVVILLDSITRLARAYNANVPNSSGRIMSGGLDSNALQRPKKFFGAARAIEGGGSLTIIGTALVDTGSKMDEVIFEEFKGTGNSELHLDRRLIEKRIYPAIDVAASGTRREELLMDPRELELIYRLRKVLSDLNVVEAMDQLRTRLKKYKTNAEFLMSMPRT